MTNGRVTGVRSVELGVHDLHQSAEFYSKVWALEPVSPEGDGMHFRATGGEHHVLTISGAAQASASGGAFLRQRPRGGRCAVREGEKLWSGRRG